MNKSLFISFDQELSGIHKEAWRKQRKYETVEELYLKNRRYTQGFAILQFRLTCFYGGEKEDELKYRSYNFYVNSSKRKCVIDGEAMEYLAENDFDFQKLFQHGISYGDKQDEQRLYEELEQRQKKRVPVAIRQRHKELEVPEKMREFLGRVRWVAEIILKLPYFNYCPISFLSAQIDCFLADKSALDLTVGPFTSHTKLFVYQIIEGKFGGRVETLKEEVGAGKIRMRKCSGSSSSGVQKQLEDKCAEERAIIEDELGMRRIVQALANSVSDQFLLINFILEFNWYSFHLQKKLLVGHNIFVHLMYIVRQFFQPLPDNYKEYKKIVNGLFPHVIDTKHLCTDQSLKTLFGTSVITRMIHTVYLPPFCPPILVADGAEFGHLIDLTRLNIASGSLRIGICFLGMMRFLGVRISGDHGELQRNAIVKPFLNKLFAKSSKMLSTAVLDAEDMFQQRDVVFHATFPSTWDRWRFEELFKNYGTVKIIFFNETSGILALSFKLSGKLHEIGDPSQIHPDLNLRPYDDYVREKWTALN